MKYKQGSLHYTWDSGKTFTCKLCGKKTTGVKVREDGVKICIGCWMKDEEAEDIEKDV